jgi:hypothetical protein
MQIKRTMDLKTGDAKLFNHGVAHNQEAAWPAREIHLAYKVLLSFSLERARKRLRGRRRALISFFSAQPHFGDSGFYLASSESLSFVRRVDSRFFEMVFLDLDLFSCSTQGRRQSLSLSVTVVSKFDDA